MIRGNTPPKKYKKEIFCGELWHAAMDGPHKSHKERMRSKFEAALDQAPERKNEIIDYARLMKRFYDVFRTYLNLPDIEQTEYKFRVQPIEGNPVWIKGTMDGITMISPQGYIREIKCRGTLTDYEIDRLGFSMQTMTYHSCFRRLFGYKAEGTEYHHIQRPLGNRNALRKKKTESKEEFHDRVVQQAKDNADKFFRVTRRPITDKELDTFEKEFLDPALQYLGWWWYCLCLGDLRKAFHFRTPWGLYSNLRHWEENEYDDFYLGGELPRNPQLTSEDI